ncbi:hypothetical protein [Aquabacterium sp.]|uniref:hypothetical protein n=1 Tax=Aquabacterium sp. TaxID=1872578 RepID=UPI004037CB40
MVFGGVRLGVDFSGAWYLLLHEDDLLSLNEEVMLYILPMLENLDPFQLRSLEAVLSQNLGKQVEPFPISSLLHQAFCGLVSDYWVSQVVVWVKSGAMVDERLAGDFAANLNNKALSQRVRHELKKLLKTT